MSINKSKRFQNKSVTKLLRFVFKGLLIAGSFLFLLFVLLNFIFPLADKIDYSIIIRDSNGQLIHAFLSKDQKWRMKTESDEISPLLKKTIVAKEDKYFYDHPGINPFAICRALVNNIIYFKRTSGASTITMQVARALYPHKRTLASKITEMFRAIQLECRYNKDQILQLYLNLVPYGGNIEGVKSASILYFNKYPDHLSLAEIMALSVIPNKPSTLIIGKQNELIIRERNKWLKKFEQEGIFTKKEIEDALKEPLTATRGSVPHYVPHLSIKLKKQAKTFDIKSSIILNTQLKIEQITADYIHGLKLKNIHNAAVIVIDNISHKVISYLGSADFKDTSDGGQVNGAEAVREPGSTLKPLLYGIAIDEGLLTPKTVITDIPVNYDGFAPENYDQKFNGYVTMEYALDHSLNIPAVKTLQSVGKEKLISKLINCHFTQIQKDQGRLGLSMILGGCGTSLEELTGLFSAFANNGVYSEPEFLSLNKKQVSREIVSVPSDFMITDILSKINRPDFPVNWTATEHMPKIAWKTGTSYGRKDAWSIGYNRKYTVGVWVGNFSGLGVPELSGANTATPLLFKIFNTIDYDDYSEWYYPSVYCGIRQVCTETGLPPGPHCTNIISDYFIPMVSTTKKCDHIEEIKISADSSISYCEACAPLTGYIKKLYVKVGAGMQDYFKQNGIAFQKIPPHNTQCNKIFKGDGPLIIAPLNGNEYFINKKDPEPIQLSAHTGNDVSKVYWYINDQFYKIANAGEKQFFMPMEGNIKISCTDDKGRNRDIRIKVTSINL